MMQHSQPVRGWKIPGMLNRDPLHPSAPKARAEGASRTGIRHPCPTSGYFAGIPMGSSASERRQIDGNKTRVSR
jgi:hypothetical protein